MAKVICIRTKQEVTKPIVMAELELCITLERIKQSLESTGQKYISDKVTEVIKLLNQDILVKLSKAD